MAMRCHLIGKFLTQSATTWFWEVRLLAYVCDCCKRPRNRGERWILGFAAERLDLGERRREISIASNWSVRAAAHPLAVHFCCEEHMRSYIAALFEDAVQHLGATKTNHRHIVGSRDDEASCATSGYLGEALRSARPLARDRGRSGSTTRRSRRQTHPRFTAEDEIRLRGMSIRVKRESGATQNCTTNRLA